MVISNIKIIKSLFNDQDPVKEKLPHPVLRNSITIKWYRDRLNPRVISKSLNDFLNYKNDNIPTTERINNLKMKSMKKKKNFDINPTFLFSQSTMKKINKLKEIFLEFDTDGSSNNY